jgi:hypothetical protein
MDNDYEFIFPSVNYDQTIYDQCNIPDPTGKRQHVVQNFIEQLNFMLTQMPGVHNFSTFFNYLDKRYKVTLIH